MTTPNTHSRTPADSRPRRIAYWTTTGLAALLMLVIGGADLVRAPEIMAGLARLGYPAYFASIIGAWKIAAAVALVIPGLPRLKEWAYAGMFFTLTGAAISHAVSADPVSKIAVPLSVLAVVLASWTLKPKPARGAPTRSEYRVRAAA